MKKVMIFGLITVGVALLATLGVTEAVADEASVENSEKKTERDFGIKRGKHRFSLDIIRARIQMAVEDGRLTQAEADEKISIIENKSKNGFEIKRGKHRFSLDIIRARIQMGVEDGRLTQAEADEKISIIENKSKNGFGIKRGKHRFSLDRTSN